MESEVEFWSTNGLPRVKVIRRLECDPRYFDKGRRLETYVF